MNGAVITALNEAGTIAELVDQLKQQGLEVCVVNDGSTDDTGIVAELAGAHVINHETRQGIGKSLVEAWHYAISQGWDYTVQIDAGGSHSASSVKMLLIRAQSCDVVIGSRFRYANCYLGGSKWRKAGSKLTAKLCNFATHQTFTDWTSGYRVFSFYALEVLMSQNYLTNGHAWQIEVLNCAVRNGLKISEATITYRAGRSTLKLSAIDELIKVYLWMLFA